MKRGPNRSKLALPLNAEGGTTLEAFHEAQRCYPIEAHGFNERTRSEESRRVNLGSTSQAQRYWAEIIDRGEATAQELYACAWVARQRWKAERYLWVPNFSTFYGPEKAWWTNFIDEAREALAREGEDE